MTGNNHARPLSARRIATALVAGALVGGLSTTFAFAASAYLFPGVAAEPSETGGGVGVIAVWIALGAISILAWGLGVVAVGGPLWLVLHKLRIRFRLIALLLGALLAGGAGYGLGLLANSPEPVWFFVVFATIGALCGWTIWAIAYGHRAARVNTP